MENTMTNTELKGLIKDLWSLPEYQRKQLAIMLMGTTLNEEPFNDCKRILKSI